MKTGGAERGVQRLTLLEQGIFKLIWVQCSMFVLWPHKETSKKVSEPPPKKVHMSTDGINWNTYEEKNIEKVWKE